MSNILTLRTSISPYGDTTKGSVLSQAELDGNFINLKGEIIYTAESLNGLVTLKKYNGNDITFTAGTGGGGGTTYTVSNGLTANTSSNFQLGGSLIRNTLIDGQNNSFIITGTKPYLSPTLEIKNTSDGMALRCESIEDVAISGHSDQDNGGVFSTRAGVALTAWVRDSPSNNSPNRTVQIFSTSSSTPVSGFGSSIMFSHETSVSNSLNT
jgi:hypothetical protein